MREQELDNATLILEYLKVILTAPVLFSMVATLFVIVFKEDIKALFLRIAKIRFPGGAEVSTPQSNQLAAEEDRPAPQPSENTEVAVTGLPADLTPQQKNVVEQQIRAHIATAYLWEYRYLNYFLVHNTQLVLDWLIGLPQATIYTYYDAVWLPIIPSANERKAIINALQTHHLIELRQEQSEMIVVTPKGREYQAWRGVVPSPSAR